MPKPFPKCRDTRECFARNRLKDCTILTEAPGRDGECRFCKRDGEVTRGVRYPWGKSSTKP